jgi:hypothetical protein
MSTAACSDAWFISKNVKILDFDEKYKKVRPCTLKGCAPFKIWTIRCQTVKEGVLTGS